MTNRDGAGLRGAAGCASLVLAVWLVCACASSGASTSAHAAGSPGRSSAIQLTCEQVSAVLSDGPDRSADPVGYAEAQILPLRQIKTPDRPLRDTITELAGAYQKFFASNGKSSNAKEAVTVASNELNSICPGAAS